MTRFEKDLKDALAGNEIEILTRRKAEIDKLTAEGRACKNAFRRTCIAQEKETMAFASRFCSCGKKPTMNSRSTSPSTTSCRQ